jgi:hypothetical protein
MKPWFSWIRWINPIYYAFEALFINELDGLAVDCAPPQLFPPAPGGPQGCAIAGAEPGATELMGQAWGNQALEFYKSHVWRNFGIIIALWLFCLAICVVVIERLPAAGSNKAVLLYKRGGGGKFIRASNQNGNGPKDEEEGSGQAAYGKAGWQIGFRQCKGTGSCCQHVSQSVTEQSANDSALLPGKTSTTLFKPMVSLENYSTTFSDTVKPVRLRP